MHLPTVINKEDNLRHIVKDKQTCECGLKYHFFSSFIKKDFKRIQFKHIKEITCPKCISSINLNDISSISNK